jgi:multimeric flavodoxin WrbA
MRKNEMEDIMSKNVLGISFGRKLSNCDIMVKHALMECERAGNEVKFIRADDLDIHICTGCISCVVGMISGRGKGECIHKDDFHILDEAIMESDSLIIACPTYETSPTGNFKVVCDRLGPSHDISFRKATYEEGMAAGKSKEDLPDERSFKKRTAALISVGGAMTKNWLAFTLPIMYEFTMATGIDVIDTFEYYGAMADEHVLGNEKVMKRMTEVGKHIVASLEAKDENDRIQWRGEEEGVCPVCHCNLLTVSQEKKSIECPVCGIYGDLSIEDGKITTHFTKKELQRSRLRWGGKLEHTNEIKTKAAAPGQIPNLKELKKKYIGYAE